MPVHQVRFYGTDMSPFLSSENNGNVVFLTINEVCKQMRVSRTTFYRLRKAGRIPHGIRVSDARVVWSRTEIMKIMTTGIPPA
jgi:predicted DNA-binding transcriptional regulator AlpA